MIIWAQLVLHSQLPVGFPMSQCYCQHSQRIRCLLMIAPNKIVKHIVGFLFEDCHLRVAHYIEKLEHLCLCALVYEYVRLQFPAYHIVCYVF